MEGQLLGAAREIPSLVLLFINAMTYYRVWSWEPNALPASSRSTGLKSQMGSGFGPCATN